MPKALAIKRAGTYDGTPGRTVTLSHDQRHLRRRMLTLDGGGELLVDLPRATVLAQGDALVLDTGELVGIVAASEPLYEVTGKSMLHLARLCWHIGNRHASAEVDQDRILIGRDHVLGLMLEGLGAAVREIEAPFTPEIGAYHDHGTAHGAHGHHGGREHGQADLA